MARRKRSWRHLAAHTIASNCDGWFCCAPVSGGRVGGEGLRDRVSRREGETSGEREGGVCMQPRMGNSCMILFIMIFCIYARQHCFISPLCSCVVGGERGGCDTNICASLYIYICVYTYTYIHKFICKYIHIGCIVQIYKRVCVCVCVCVCVFMYICIYI